MDNKSIAQEALENALYATGKYLPEECTNIAVGILVYLNDVGVKLVREEK